MIETMAQIHHDDMVPIIAISVGGTVVLVWIVLTAIYTYSKMRTVEKTRREIAAYIAEGSMTPEQGERLLKASPKEIDDA